LIYFRQKWHRANNLQSKKEFVGVNAAPPFSYAAPPKNKQYWGVNRRSQPKSETIKSCCIDSNQIVHSDKDHQDALRGWFKHAHHKSKMAEGRHLVKIEKSLYLSNGLIDRHKIWQDDAV